jgi:hypothetical protein
MIIEQKTRNVVVNSESLSKAFNFTLDSRTASLLVDPYANKEEATLRETSQNADDSHRVAGQSRPFEVSLPTMLDLTLIVKDYGTGIDPEKMPALYGTIGGSDKFTNNDVVGGLGIGKLAPLSVTDQFTLESRFNGTVYHYAIFRNEAGIPSYNEMGSAPTDEPNGVTVRVPIDSSRVAKFQEAAKRIFRYFNPIPVVTGVDNFEIEPFEFIIKKPGWRLPKSDSGYLQSSRAVQGTVSYPISTNSLGDLSDIEGHVLAMGVHIDFNIGEVQVAPSREALSYTTSTVEAIRSKLANIAVEIREHYIEMFNKCDNLYEARKTYKLMIEDSRSSYALGQIIDQKIMWGDLLINTAGVVGDQKETPDVSFYGLSTYQMNRSRIKLSADDQWHVTCGATKILFWDGKIKNIRPYLTHYYAGGKVGVLVLKASGVDKIQPILDKIGGAPFTDLNDLDEPPKDNSAKPVAQTSGGPRTPTADVFQYTGYVFNPTKLPADHGGRYINLTFGNSESFIRGDKHCTTSTLRSLEVQWLGDDAKSLYGIPATHKTLPKRYPSKWTHYFDDLERLVRLAVSDPKTAQKVVNYRNCGNYFFTHEYAIKFCENSLDDKRDLPPKMLKTSPFYKLYTGLQAMGTSKSLYGLSELCEVFGIDLTQKPTFEGPALLEECNQRYGLFLPVFTNYHSSSNKSLFDPLCDYLVLCK